MSFGLPAQLAKRLGLETNLGAAPLAGGASFAAAQAIGQFQFYARLNQQSGANIYQMPSNAEPGSEFTLVNIGTVAVTCAVYPPTNGTFNTNVNGVTATAIVIATGKGAFVIAVTASTMDILLSS
jgi:hypothetical protein